MSSTTTARQRKAHVLLLLVVHFSSLLSFFLSLSLSACCGIARQSFKRITKEKKKASTVELE